ncbi:MAG: hypothetical protein IJ217_02460 [Clostridia bacterium]|nr:hypothetical protein [Clostridia bacterium]
MLTYIIYGLVAVLILFLLGWFLVEKMKVNLNEYVAYIFAVICVVLAVDRVAELFRVLLTGELATYWSPIGYTLAYLACVAGFQFMCGSPMNVTLRHPMKFFVFFSLCFYGIFLGMTAQWSNEIIYFCLMNLSNFKYIATNMPEVIAPAVAGLSLIIPVSTFRGRWKYYMGNVVDGDSDWIESFEEYGGTKLSFKKKKDTLPEAFECNAPICVDDKTGKVVFIPEKKRFEATMVQGATGTGKTSTMVEPMCANDIERKYFFRELSKKLGYNALQTGLADMTVPYSNDYLNRNFTLNFLKPRDSRMKEYKDYMKDMITYVDPATNEIYYRGLGFTLVAPDNACIERVRKVANAYSMDVNVIDPMDPNSYGINPFTGKDPAKVAAIISTVLKGMYQAENSESSAFFANVTQQAFENLAILLKLVYPRMHNGEIPTLEDMLSILNNFDIAEEMCEVLKKDPQLAEDYKSLIGYFEKNFYKPPVNIHGYEIASTYGSGRKETEKHVYGAITQLDNFLRNPGVKRVLCSRNNNIDLDKALQNGEIITACTRQGDLGETHQKAFGMFVILSFKDAVLRRPGDENTRTPHFIYIDEFPLYVNKDTEAFFTLFRKYRCGTLITIQNLSQLTKTSSLAYFKDVVITNTKTQILFGDMTNEESIFWEGELGKYKKWTYRAKKIYDDKDADSSKAQTEALMAEKKAPEEYYKAGKIVGLKFKQCIYKTKNAGGKTIVGRGMADFIDKKYYEEHKCSKYDFQLYADANSSSASENAKADSHFFTGNNDKERMASSDDNVVDVVVDSSILRKKNDNSGATVDLSNMNSNDSVIIDFKK